MCNNRELLDNPYALAIFSAFFAAFLTFLIEKFVSWQKNNDNRKAQLRILRSYFIIERRALTDIQDMDDEQIHAYINSTVVLTLLRGEYLSPSKDETLITSLNEYVQTTEQINRVFKIIDLKSSGFTQGQIANAEQTKQNLKNAIPEFLILVDSCVAEINLKLQ